MHSGFVSRVIVRCVFLWLIYRIIMEKLSAAQQAQLKKMSNERLRVKLMAAGYEEDVLIGYERDDLLSTYAEIIASEKIRTGPVTYDPKVEKDRLLFERQKWEIEMEKRKRKEEFERQRWEADNRRWEAEMELRKQELTRQSAKDAAEQERRDSSVMKEKLFGDAMRGSAIRMGADPIDAVPFFRNVEQLFKVYDLSLIHI